MRKIETRARHSIKDLTNEVEIISPRLSQYASMVRTMHPYRDSYSITDEDERDVAWNCRCSLLPRPIDRLSIFAFASTSVSVMCASTYIHTQKSGNRVGNSIYTTRYAQLHCMSHRTVDRVRKKRWERKKFHPFLALYIPLLSRTFDRSLVRKSTRARIEWWLADPVSIRFIVRERKIGKQRRGDDADYLFFTPTLKFNKNARILRLTKINWQW